VDYKVRASTAPPAGAAKVIGYDAAGVVVEAGPQASLWHCSRQDRAEPPTISGIPNARTCGAWKFVGLHADHACGIERRCDRAMITSVWPHSAFLC
jgi:hypothetical protein